MEKVGNEQSQNQEQLFLLGMILSMFCWGISWASGKVLSGYGDILSLSLFRFGITFAALFVLLLLIKENLKVQRKGWLVLLGAALCMSLYNYLFFKGLFHGKPGAGGVLVTTLNPIISYAIMLLFTWRKPSQKEALGLIIGAFAGIVLLRAWSNWQSILDSGNLYFVLASLNWAILSLFTAKASRYGSPIAFSLWLYAVGVIVFSLLTRKEANLSLWYDGDVYFWGNMLFSAVITTTFATTFYFVATARLGASRASSFIFLVPFSAALGAWVFLHETPQWYTLVGGTMGIAAVYIINKK